MTDTHYISFWERMTYARITSSSYFTKHSQCPTDGLAWDWVNKKLYWTDAEDNDIEVIDPVTNHRKLLISTGSTTTPRAIVLDPQNK